MALTNFTEDEKYQKTSVELFCSPELISGVDGELIFLSALNIFLSIAAFLAEHSDPSCSAQGNFTSSAVQTPVS